MHRFQPRPPLARTSSKAVTARLAKHGRSILGAGILFALLLQFLGAKLLFSTPGTMLGDEEFPPAETGLPVNQSIPESAFMDRVLQPLPPERDEKEDNKTPDWAVDLVLSTPPARTKEEQYAKINALMINGLIPESLHGQLVAKVARGEQLSLGNVDAALQLNSRSQISRESAPSNKNNNREKMRGNDAIPISDLAPPEIPVSDIAPRTGSEAQKGSEGEEGGRIVGIWGGNLFYCGDGEKQEGEECDDGNTRAWDGCSAFCSVEKGWLCAPGTSAGAVSGARSLCHQTQPEPVLRVLLLPAHASLAPSPIPSDVELTSDYVAVASSSSAAAAAASPSLCLRDCASCRGPSGDECRQYCAHGLGMMARTENAPMSCVFKRKDAVLRCLAHPECRSVTCVDREQRRPQSAMLDDFDFDDGVSMDEAERQRRMLCVAFAVGVSDAAIDSSGFQRAGEGPGVPWPAELKQCQKFEGSCETLVLAEDKQFQLLRRLTPDRVKSLEAQLQDKQSQFSSLIVNRTQLQATVSDLDVSQSRNDRDTKERAIHELFRLQALHKSLAVDIPTLNLQLLLRISLDLPIQWISPEEWAQNRPPVSSGVE